jgi:hypothetical protein
MHGFGVEAWGFELDWGFGEFGNGDWGLGIGD